MAYESNKRKMDPNSTDEDLIGKQFKSFSSEVHELKIPINTSKKIESKDSINSIQYQWHQKDVQWLLLILPEEIWHMVLDNVNDTSCLENLSNASIYFRLLLKPRRIYFLFPNVFRILAPKIGYGRDENNSMAYYDDYFLDWPFWFHMIIKLRRVCSSWKNSVDNYYDNHWLNYQMEHDHYDQDQQYCENPKTIGELTRNFAFKFDEGWDRFIDHCCDHFEITHGNKVDRNPFFGRILTLDKNNQRNWYQSQLDILWDAETVNNSILRLMRGYYGQHVWNLVFKIHDNYLSRLDYIRLLHEWLVLLPNLKTLKIYYSSDDSNMAGGMTFSENVLQQMEAELHENPFPKLKQLNFLKTENLPSPVFNNLISVNNHISKLDVQRHNVHEKYGLHTVQLPNLTQLSWKICSDADIDHLEATKLDWMQLEKLHLPYPPNTESGSASFDKWLRIFELANQKLSGSTKLADLMIQLPGLEDSIMEYLTKTGSLKLNLPNVQRLKLLLSSPSSLDFLLPMKDSLKLLDVSACYLKQTDNFKKPKVGLYGVNKVEKQVGVTQFYEWEEKLFESNFWTLFPKLAKITRYDSQEVLMRGKQAISLKWF